MSYLTLSYRRWSPVRFDLRHCRWRWSEPRVADGISTSLVFIEMFSICFGTWPAMTSRCVLPTRAWAPAARVPIDAFARTAPTPCEGLGNWRLEDAGPELRGYRRAQTWRKDFYILWRGRFMKRVRQREKLVEDGLIEGKGSRISAAAENLTDLRSSLVGGGFCN